MKVETFEVTEVGCAGKIDNFEEINALSKQLGLTGQERFLNQDKKEVIPYRKMTAQEKLVYETLCAEKTILKDYKESIIPLRVLQVASHAIELEFLTGVEVWHETNADIKDPVLVGYIGSDSWRREYYILARWGEELESFGVLMEKAIKILVEDAKAVIKKEIAELQSAEFGLENLVRSKALQGKQVSISAYIQ